MITVEEAKAHCRIEHGAEDGLITSLIAAAFRYIENRTGQTFDRVSGAEMVLDALPAAVLPLRCHPLPAQPHSRWH